MNMLGLAKTPLEEKILRDFMEKFEICMQKHVVGKHMHGLILPLEAKTCFWDAKTCYKKNAL